MPPHYYGIFENNDRTKQWSDAHYYSIYITNDAYKLGVNYLVYAMSH